MSFDLINIIFGMKLRRARTEAGFTLTEFAALCELSPSYVTEIEKGRKYPRADKIMKMAEVLDKEYDSLVSIKLDPSLTYLESTLSSSVVQRFPFEEFGFEAGDLVNLLTRKPDKASPLLHAILEIGRRYDLTEEDFLRAALRSYQELHENYFPELEEAAIRFTEAFGNKYPINEREPASLSTLEAILQNEYGYEFDDTTIAQSEDLNKYRSVFVAGSQPRFYINSVLYSRQVKFLLARELGYQFLGLKERSLTSTPDKIDSFEQLLNDFKAAYFGGALLMPRALFLEDIQQFFDRETWSARPLLDMLAQYNVTPEMLLYRFSELVPQFFGIKLHFLRFHHARGSDSYELIKHLNMNQLLVPSGIGLFETYCRRWLSVRLLREIEAIGTPKTVEEMPIGIQLSEYLEDAADRYLCFGFARQMVLSPDVYSSVTIGFRVDNDLKHAIRFAEDPTVPHAIINETCERCPLTPTQCHVRGAKPTILQEEQRARARKLALSQLQHRK